MLRSLHSPKSLASGPYRDLVKSIQKATFRMKTIPFTCPHCGTYTEVANDYAGQTGPCAACRKPVTVPDLADTSTVRRLPRSRSFTKAILFVLSAAFLGGVFVTVFGLIFIAAFQPESIPFLGQVAPPPPVCKSNLEKIYLALDAYAREHGTYPPAYTVDEKGKPMHSWRVLLLPYLDENQLFSKYDMTKPWDDPINMQAVGRRMPEVYGCPNMNSSRDETSYMVVCGPTLVFDGVTKRRPEDITDKMSETMLVIEVADTDVHWMEPVDLSVTSMTWIVNADKGIGSHHSTPGMHVLTADGVVHHLEEMTPPEELQSIATRGGGEVAAIDEWETEAQAGD